MFLLPSPASPDFAYEPLVKQQAQGEENQALQKWGEEHPAQGVGGEGVLVGINAVAAENLDLHIDPGQLHQAVAEAELGEDQKGLAQLLEGLLDGLSKGN